MDDVNDIEYPTTGYAANIANTISGCTVAGGTIDLALNIGPAICQITSSTVTTQPIPNSTWTDLQWDDNIYDPSALHNPASNNTNIFIKSPGWYRLTGIITFASNATGKRGARFMWNGNLIDRSTVLLAGSSACDAVLVTSIIKYADPGDNFRMQGFQDSGGALNFKGNESSFSVELIGG